MFYSVLVGTAAIFVLATVPNLVHEGSVLVTRLQSDSVWGLLLSKTRAGLGDGVMDKLEQVILMAGADDLGRVAAAVSDGGDAAQRAAAVGAALKSLLGERAASAADWASSALTGTARAVVSGLVALVLSFIVIWDLPTIRSGVASLADSRVGGMYREVAPAAVVFGTLLGKALEAQARISLVNTALTALGLWALALPGIALLSFVTFVCGFIPVAGVLLSTFPMAFVALTEYGVGRCGAVLLMVLGVHCVEAYGLNPIIYSNHLKLHPLLVLSVLVAAEHLLGVWGLLVAVPLTVFLLDYCIRMPQLSASEVATRELEAVERGALPLQ